jgi:hypothetical protein
MESGGLLDDLNALFHSIVGDSAQWACLLGLLLLLLLLICIGFTLLLQTTEGGNRPQRRL